ncbi:MAG: hypothetical protein ABI333_05510 [bacterium]
MRQVKVVLLVERGDLAARATLTLALHTQLSRQGVPLSVVDVRRFAGQLPEQLAMAHRAAELHRATVVVWFSLTRTIPLFAYFLDPAGSRVVMRSFDEMEPEERAEAAAIVVGSAVRVFQRGERPGTDARSLPQGLPKQWTKKPKPRPRKRTVGVALEVGYAYAYDDWDGQVTGMHNVHVRFVLRVHRWLSLLAGYQWIQPVSLSATLDDAGSRTSVQLRPHRVSLGAQMHFPLGRRWELGPSLSMAAEIVDYVLDDAPLVVDRKAPPPYLITLIPSFHVGVRLAKNLRLVADVGLEIALRMPTLRLALPGGSEPYSTFGKPNLLRPRVLLALALDIY